MCACTKQTGLVSPADVGLSEISLTRESVLLDYTYFRKEADTGKT